MSKCCLYCRVDGTSTESNRLAINQQLTVLRSLARQLGFSISTEMLQYESGLDANRQSIRTLIRDARHGVYGRVLVMNGDRLARDAEGLAAIGEKLTAAGIRVYCPDGEMSVSHQSECLTELFIPILLRLDLSQGFTEGFLGQH